MSPTLACSDRDGPDLLPSLFIRLVGITPGEDDNDMTVDGEDVPQGFTPTFNIQDEVVRFQVSDRSITPPTPILTPGKTTPEKEMPWYMVFQATTIRPSQDVLQFDRGGGQRPTTIACLVASDDISPNQMKKLKMAVTPCVAPNADSVMK